MSVEVRAEWDDVIAWISDGTGSDWGPIVTLGLRYREKSDGRGGIVVRTLDEIKNEPVPNVAFLTPAQARAIAAALIADADRIEGTGEAGAAT